MLSKNNRVKILQVVHSMNRGGVEVWLMHVLRGIDHDRFQIDFVTFSDKQGDFDEEAFCLGARMFTCSPPSNPLGLVHDFKSIMERYGPYDVVHSHDATWSGTVLALARKFKVPIRITHSHNNIRQSLPQGFFKRVYTKWNIHKSKQCSTHGMACSRLAAESYFGRDWQSDPRWGLFYCGEDFSPFFERVDSRSIRQSLGIPENAIIIGHVGSFRNTQKNHTFFVSVARELVKLNKQVHFLLVGDGILRSDIEKQIKTAGLNERAFFTGVRADVPFLMLGAMDLFLFPSLSEGLGLVLVEAQAAGLPCICSDVIPEEADIVTGLVTRMSLTKSPRDWAEAVLNVLNTMTSPTPQEALRIVNESNFNLSNSIRTLERVYAGESYVHNMLIN